MNLLVTAGNTQMPVDRVRCITNVFTGRTGAAISSRAFDRGHSVTLLTSHPEVVNALTATRPRASPDWRVRSYRTYDDLDRAMAEEVSGGTLDAVIHAAAVSDYRVAGVYTRCDGDMADAAAAKVKGSYPELWLKLTPTPKLVDKVRTAWGFAGVLVKFKLEVGLTVEALVEVAEAARVHSAADVMVANTLEGMHAWALVGSQRNYRQVPRAELPNHLLDLVEALNAK